MNIRAQSDVRGWVMQGGKTAVEIFEGVVDELRDVFRADKSRLRNLVPKYVGTSCTLDLKFYLL